MKYNFKKIQIVFIALFLFLDVFSVRYAAAQTVVCDPNADVYTCAANGGIWDDSSGTATCKCPGTQTTTKSSGDGTGVTKNTGDGTNPSAANSCPDETNYEKINGVCVPKTPFTGGLAGPNTKSLTDLITSVVKYLLMFAGIIGVVILIIGGYQYMTSAGNEEQAEKGRKTIINAIIGLMVVILSYTIISVITNFITKT